MAAECVRIEDPSSGASAEVLVSLGFNCFSWRAPFAAGEEPRELLWAEPGFEQGDKKPSRSGVPLLFPFPGRIREGKFEFGGKTYELERNDGLGNAIHGYALDAPWRVLQQTTDSLTAEFRPSIDAPEKLPLWTGDYRVEATYRIEGAKLVLDATFENVGDSPLPWSFGTHAYFRMPLADESQIEHTIIEAPLDGLWRTEGLVPDGEVLPLGDYAAIPSGLALNGNEFDTTFRMAPGEELATEVRDPQSGRVVRQTFGSEMRCCVIFTPGHREAVCLEPYTSVTNAYELEANGIDTGLRVLGPGESEKSVVTLEALTR